MPRVLLGISGGVDSATAAWMLKRDGYEVVAVTLLFSDVPREQAKYEKAVQVCSALGIEHHRIDLRETFAKKVKEPYALACAQGAVPDPISIATAQVLLPALFDARAQYGCERVATGHYARIARESGMSGVMPFQLAAARDAYHDQTYYLYTLRQDQLASIMFPLWDTPAPVVRMLAMRAGLMLAEFQEEPLICFLEDNDRLAWLEGEMGLSSSRGDVVHLSTHALIAAHEGLYKYDIGDALKLESPLEMGDDSTTSPDGKYGGDIALPDPYPKPDSLYVIAKDSARNRLLVGPQTLAGAESCTLRDVVWTSIERPREKRSCKARIAWNRKPVPVQVVGTEHGVVVTFNERAFGLKAGNPVVFYSDTMVLGGGIVAG